ncbi:PAS domain-containing protein [Desulfocurvus sp. DL9XJH121]
MDNFTFYAQRLERTNEYGLLIEPSGRILYANAVWRRRHGLKPGAEAGSIYDGMQADAARWVRSAMAEAQQGPPMRDKAITVRTADGRGVRQVLWRGMEVVATDGAGSLIVAMGRPLDPVGGPGEAMGFTIRPDGAPEDISEKVCALCGYSREEVLGMTVADFYYDGEERRRILRDLGENGCIERGVVTLSSRDGTPVPLAFTARALADGNGGVWAYGGYFKARQEPLASDLARRFGPIVDALPDIAWVSGRDHRLAAVNESYARAFRLRRADVLGATENDLFPPATARALIRSAIRVFEDGRESETPMAPHFSGAPGWLRIIRRPIFDESGREVVGLLGVCRDITRQAERETVFMRSIAEDEQDAVLVIDAQGRLIRRNEASFTPSVLGNSGTRDGDAFELTGILDVLHPEDIPRAQRVMRMVLAGRGPQRMECRVRNERGRYSVVGFTAHFNDEFFNEPRMYVVARDMGRAQQLRRAELVLERLKRATGSRTFRELAAFLNVSPASVSNAKSQQRVPADWLVAVGRDTGWSMDWLFTGLGVERRGE